MRSYLGLCASALCFTSAGAIIAILAIQQPSELFIIDGLQELTGLTYQTLRNAAFFLLGVDVILGVVLFAVWLCARQADAKMRGVVQECDAAPDLYHRRDAGHIRASRPAFTLIELLVVIAIIAILAALVLAGVFAFLRKGPEAKNRNDILQLGIGLQKFHDKYGFYPPSKIKLCPQFSGYNMAQALDKQSVAYLSAMWPNINRSKVFAWAGQGVTMPASGVVLEGHQCLVFFLGGIPRGSNKAPDGFANDATWPTNPAATDKFKFFEFDGGRCEYLGGSLFPSYLDSHVANHGKKIPFAYFSSFKRSNGYSPFGTSDNASFGVSPYIETSTPAVKYYNATTYQIISAGPDGAFGSGGVWPPASTAGKDDISNFYDRNLGS